MDMRFWLWKNFVMFSHGTFCGYALGYVGIYLCMGMNMWESFFFDDYFGYVGKETFDCAWLWEKFGSCACVCEKKLLAVKFWWGIDFFVAGHF